MRSPIERKGLVSAGSGVGFVEHLTSVVPNGRVDR